MMWLLVRQSSLRFSTIRTTSAISRGSRGDVDRFAVSRSAAGERERERKREREREREGWMDGHSSVKSASRGCATWNVQESRRRVETSGCFGEVHPRSLHSPAPPRPRPFALPPTLQPLSAMAPSARAISRGVLLDYDRETPKPSTRRLAYLSVSPWSIFFSSAAPRKSISGLLRHPRHPACRSSRSIGLL